MIYEVRTYDMKPGTVADFEKAFGLRADIDEHMFTANRDDLPRNAIADPRILLLVVISEKRFEVFFVRHAGRSIADTTGNQRCRRMS